MPFVLNNAYLKGNTNITLSDLSIKSLAKNTDGDFYNAFRYTANGEDRNYIYKSVDGGFNWTNTNFPKITPSLIGSPQLIASGAGWIHVFMPTSDGIWYADNNGAGWTNIKRIVQTTNDFKVIIDSQDHFHLAFKKSGAIYYCNNLANSFSDPKAIYTPSNGYYFDGNNFDMMVDANEKVHFIIGQWKDSNPAKSQLIYLNNTQTTWPSVLITEEFQRPKQISSVFDSNGKIHFTYANASGVWYINNKSGWSNTELVKYGKPILSQLFVDSNGTPYFTYFDNNKLSWVHRSTNAWTDSKEEYLQKNTVVQSILFEEDTCYTIQKSSVDTKDILFNMFKIANNLSVSTKPTISLTAPANGTQYSGKGNHTLQVTVSGVTVQDISFYRVNADSNTLLGGGATSSYNWQNVDVGYYFWTVVVKYNNVFWTTKAISFNVAIPADNTPPAVTISNPANNQKFDAYAPVLLTAQVVDMHGIQDVKFYVDGNEVKSFTAAPYEYSIPGLTSGNHTLKVKATDIYAMSTEQSITVRVGVSASCPIPTATITSKELTNTNGTVPIAIDVNPGTGQTVKKIDLYADGKLVGTTSIVTNNKATINYHASVSQIVKPKMKAKIMNSCGAESWSAEVEVTIRGAGVDSVPPASSPPSRPVDPPKTTPPLKPAMTGKNTPEANIAEPVPPVPMIILPEEEDSVSPGGSVVLKAKVAFADAANPCSADVSNVRFFFDNMTIGAATLVAGTTDTYQMTWTNVPEGIHAITCKAVGNGLTGESEPVNLIAVQFSNFFQWTNPKKSGALWNLSAAEWNAFTGKINQMRSNQGLSASSFTTVSVNDPFTATIFNQAITALGGLKPKMNTFIRGRIPKIKKGVASVAKPEDADLIDASDFNKMRDGLNSI